MFKQERVRFNTTQYVLVSMAMLLLLVVTPLAVMAGSEDVGRFGGDDAYDPAAGGAPVLPLAMVMNQAASSTSYGGDDAYDPAASSVSRLPVAVATNQVASSTSFGGDDAYDPAAGASAAIECGLSAEEIAARKALTVVGGLSGDDAYDPAAGGTPTLSLLAYADFASLLAACESVGTNN